MQALLPLFVGNWPLLHFRVFLVTQVHGSVDYLTGWPVNGVNWLSSSLSCELNMNVVMRYIILEASPGGKVILFIVFGDTLIYHDELINLCISVYIS